MTDVLQQELTGNPVTVTIAGKVCRLAYPMHAVILLKQMAGVSLFHKDSWDNIDLDRNPELWVKCLWVGLQERHPDGTWKAPFTLEELEEHIEYHQAPSIAAAIVTSLTRYLPTRPTDQAEAKDDRVLLPPGAMPQEVTDLDAPGNHADPNAATPGEPAATVQTSTS